MAAATKLVDVKPGDRIVVSGGEIVTVGRVVPVRRRGKDGALRGEAWLYAEGSRFEPLHGLGATVQVAE